MFEYQDLARLESIIEEQRFAISKISHEVRNPVTLINSSLQIIEKEHPEVCSFTFWNSVRSDMNYLVELLNELSNYNNGETLHKETVITSQWIQEITTSIEGTLLPGHIFVKKIDSGLPEINIDPIKMRQAVSNLIRNALEAIGTDGIVSLHTYVKGTNLIIEVRDNGCGIDEEYMADLFTPFVTHKTGGTGLGLAITKRVVETHTGALSVTTTPGQGTTFIISLPI